MGIITPKAKLVSGSIRLEAELWERLRAIAKKNGLSVNDVLIELLDHGAAVELGKDRLKK